jgi:hypothetical protein
MINLKDQLETNRELTRLQNGKVLTFLPTEYVDCSKNTDIKLENVENKLLNPAVERPKSITNTNEDENHVYVRLSSKLKFL